MSSDSLYPSQPFSPAELLRKISASFEVARALRFLTDSIVGGAKSPVIGSDDDCCDFLEDDNVSSSREVVYLYISITNVDGDEYSQASTRKTHACSHHTTQYSDKISSYSPTAASTDLSLPLFYLQTDAALLPA